MPDVADAYDLDPMGGYLANAIRRLQKVCESALDAAFAQKNRAADPRNRADDPMGLDR